MDEVLQTVGWERALHVEGVQECTDVVLLVYFLGLTVILDILLH